MAAAEVVLESSALLLLARSGSGDPDGLNEERLELTAESPSVSSADMVPLSSAETATTSEEIDGGGGGFELGGLEGDMLPLPLSLPAGKTVSSLRLNAGEYLGNVGELLFQGSELKAVDVLFCC